ncbi:MAG: MmcQ/YjbR family DNA-binding protein [Candidatus Nanopelagicales bacterium]
MAHPRMYDDDDPILNRLRGICLGFPESVEVEAWGRPTFRAGKKIFAVYGSGEQDPNALIFTPDAEDRAALAQDPRFFSPPYFGPNGGLALDLAAAGVDWDEVAELLDSSYRRVALKRMLTALGAREL